MTDCCKTLDISAGSQDLNSAIAGKYEYDQDYKGVPAYKRTSSPTMYLFWQDNRWIVWRKLGEDFYCDPWWAFWNCKGVYGWIRYDDDYKCPEQIGTQWKSAYTQSLDSSIKVSCDNTVSTTTSNPGK